MVVALWWLAGRDFHTLGLRTRAEPSWRFWLGATAAIGLAVAVVCVGYLLVTEEYKRLSFAGPIGRWPTVIVSGAIFGLIHIVNGVAGPDNVVAGYFFAWAFLRSGSIALPTAMHAGGNLVVALLQPTI